MYSWYEVSIKGWKTAIRAKNEDEAKQLWCNFNGYLSELPDMTVQQIDDGDDNNAPAGYTSIIW